MTKIVYDQNDNLIKVNGLEDDAAAGTYLNAATVTATLQDPDGSDVTGATNITLNYIAASNGNYEGTIESTVTLTVGPGYLLVIDADEGGVVGHWELEAEVIARRA